MFLSDTEIIIKVRPWGKMLEISLMQRGPDFYFTAEPVVMKKRENEAVVSPAFLLSAKEVQKLSDQLGRLGYAPSQQTPKDSLI